MRGALLTIVAAASASLLAACTTDHRGPATGSGAVIAIRCPENVFVRNSVGGQLVWIGPIPGREDEMLCMTSAGPRRLVMGSPPDQAATTRLFRSIQPLRVGSRSHGFVAGTAADGSSSQWTYTLEVLARERITTPAGSFETVRMRLTEEGAFNNIYMGTSDTWIDIRTGAPVRYQYRFRQGRQPQHPPWDAIEVRVSGAATLAPTAATGGQRAR